jgi:hypothetical protein
MIIWILNIINMLNKKCILIKEQYLDFALSQNEVIINLQILCILDSKNWFAFNILYLCGSLLQQGINVWLSIYFFNNILTELMSTCIIEKLIKTMVRERVTPAWKKNQNFQLLFVRFLISHYIML